LPVNQGRQDSPTLGKYVQQMAIINQVYTALKGYAGGDPLPDPELVEGEPVETGVSFAPLTRIRTQRQKRYDQLQVFTHTFTTSFKDSTAQPVYTKPHTSIKPSIELE